MRSIRVWRRLVIAAAAWCVFAAATVHAGALAASEGRGGAAGVQPGRRLSSAAQEPLTTLIDPVGDPAQRRLAADHLVAQPWSRELDQSLRLVLIGGAGGQGAADALLSALASSPSPGSGVAAILRESLVNAPAERIPAILAAFGSCRSRESARLLLEYTGASQPPAVRAAAFRALARLSGHGALGSDREAWLAWFRRASAGGESAWLAAIADGQAARADSLVAQRIAALDRLLDAMRRLYVLAPAEEKARLLASLLLDDSDDLRSLGLDLLGRELSAGRAPDGVVAEACTTLVRHRSPTTRARAALLLAQLAPAAASGPIVEALLAEGDSEAAAGLLSAAARWPSERWKASAVRWLENGPETTGPAVEALLSLTKAGMLDRADRDRVAAALRRLPAESVTPAGVRLLVQLGDASDRRAASEWLHSASAAMRLAAAESLADDAEFTDALLAAAGDDAALFDAAGRAILGHRASAAGLRGLLDVPGPAAGAKRAAAVSVAAGLPIKEIVAAAQAIDDAALIDAMLSRLANRRPSVEPAGSPAEPVEPLAHGLLLLAKARLAMGRPEEALNALDVLPSASSELNAGAAAVRTVALLWTNRPADAEPLDAPASAWLDGLEAAAAEPHAAQLVRLMGRRFGDRLTPAEQERLARVAAKIARTAVGEAQGPPVPDR